jgi:hypothetical protein
MLKKIVAAFLPPVELRVSDFSAAPSGRRLEDGLFSATRYREEILMPFMRDNRRTVIIFDDLNGVASSWLNEAFAHPVTRQYGHLISFASKGYSRIYDKIASNFLRGVRPYTG